MPVFFAAPEHPPLAATIEAFGAARAGMDDLPRLRKTLPDWAPADTPGHFLKHADEQTLVAVRAVDQAARGRQEWLAGSRDCGIVVAARYPGRLAAAQTLDRFGREGSPSVSPHIVPQHSLHSTSGALSILLGVHGPNVGVGGGARALEDGLLAALTLFDPQTTSRWWFVVTGWDPEPVPGCDGALGSQATCYAAAFAMSAAAAAGCGQLTLSLRRPASRTTSSPQHPAELGRAVLAAQMQGLGARLAWTTIGGGTIEMSLESSAARLAAAA